MNVLFRPELLPVTPSTICTDLFIYELAGLDLWGHVKNEHREWPEDLHKTAHRNCPQELT